MECKWNLEAARTGGLAFSEETRKKIAYFKVVSDSGHFPLKLMVISEEHGFIFIHLIKTAGTSITAALKPFGKTHKQIPGGYTCHDSAEVLISKLGKETYKSFFSFAIVRNPWDLLVSNYNYVLKSPKHARHAEFKAFSGYAEYLEWQFARGFKNQRDHLFCGEEQVVDFIGRYENIESDWKIICERIGISVGLPLLNTTKTQPYQDFYTPELVELVAHEFEPDIRQFGYQFESGKDLALA